jgi:hypothetical protein
MTRIHVKTLNKLLCVSMDSLHKSRSGITLESTPALFDGAGRYCIRGLGRIHKISRAQTYLKRKVTPSFQQTKVWLFAIGIQFNKFDL